MDTRFIAASSALLILGTAFFGPLACDRDAAPEESSPPERTPATDELTPPGPESQTDEASDEFRPPDDDDLVTISAGSFQMGAVDGDIDSLETERPRHEVILTRDFLLQKTPVTQSQFNGLDRNIDSAYEPCPSCPADNVDWHDAIAYVNALSDADDLPRCYSTTGQVADGDSVYECRGYRLPTEAEWEYAARAGTTGRFFWGNSAARDTVERHAWYHWNSGDHTQPVGLTEPNDWGLFDVAGNVEEWTHDAPRRFSQESVTDPGGAVDSDSDTRVLRGGNIMHRPDQLRLSHRHLAPLDSRNFKDFPSGFRVARTVHE